MTSPFQALPDDPAELAALADAVFGKLAAAPMAAVTEDGLLAVVDTLEAARRRLDGVDAAVLTEVSDRAVFRKAGYLSLHAYLSAGLRLGDGAAKRRRTSVAAIGRFTNLQGQTLAPACPATAAAVADGAIGADHVREIDAVMDKIPAAVDPQTRGRAEAQLAAVARDLTPDGVRMAGVRLLAHLDPDGQLTDDRDRRRRRGVAVMPQGRDLMSKVRALLTPALRAEMEIMLGSWAAPGMNNPDDPDSPSGAVEAADPTVLAAAAERDDRTAMQRNHDALLAMFQFLRASTGQGAGRLSSELVITVTDKELREQAGVAITATGTRVPVTDLVRVAAGAVPHLAVFSHATGQPLYLGRGRRFASKAQRLMLFARDRGCTAPGCAAPFARTEAHHLREWQNGGRTDIGNLGAACGRHNRSVGRRLGDWETVVLIDGRHAGRVAWRPVTAGRTPVWRVNPLHHAELLPDQGPNAPPAEEDSRAEAYLARLLAA
ncbi:HNH endonuclease signature motif containing protein [Gordonia aichiensis]|uniref:HNH endonuclease signature motif containing protein n=2 Tax=Gordonia TaxID=2053 RepID=UPI003266B127